MVRDTLTKGERSLVATGRSELVLAARQGYQQAMGPDAIKLVEECTGRKVSAFLSASHLQPDVAVEVFVLEPRKPLEASAVSEAKPG